MFLYTAHSNPSDSMYKDSPGHCSSSKKYTEKENKNKNKINHKHLQQHLGNQKNVSYKAQEFHFEEINKISHVRS